MIERELAPGAGVPLHTALLVSHLPPSVGDDLGDGAGHADLRLHLPLGGAVTGLGPASSNDRADHELAVDQKFFDDGLAPSLDELDTGAAGVLRGACHPPGPPAGGSKRRLRRTDKAAASLRRERRMRVSSQFGIDGFSPLFPFIQHQPGCSLAMCQTCGLCGCAHSSDGRCTPFEDLLTLIQESCETNIRIKIEL